MGALYYDCGPGGLMAPAAPTDFVVSHNNELLVASLSWVNPTLTPLGDPLTELTGVKVYRNNQLIADLTDAVIGQPYEYDDETVPASGMYDYKLWPYNSYGNGLWIVVSAWIGPDAPGEATDVIAIPDPNQQLECTITWTAPTQGEHGGYYTPGLVNGQRIYRNGNLIADLPGNNTFEELIAQWNNEAIPDVYSLRQNYPNPFNPMTVIGFNLPEDSRVKLTVYDISGRLVATVIDGYRQAGSHEVNFDGSRLASGMYIYRLTAGDWSANGKMVLLK